MSIARVPDSPALDQISTGLPAGGESDGEMCAAAAVQLTFSLLLLLQLFSFEGDTHS